MTDELLETIKSRGYWRINFQPLGPPADFTIQECDRLIRDNHVQLRGWYYPFYASGDRDNHGFTNRNGYRQGWIDAGEFKEFWNMYKSGQFLHYSAVHEDWMDVPGDTLWGNHEIIEPGAYLNFIGSLTMLFTEIYELLVRLHREGLYSDGVKISISLINTQGRKLKSFDVFREPSYDMVCRDSRIDYTKTYSPSDLQQPARDLAIPAIVHFFEMFNFEDVSVDLVIKKDQDMLYGFR